MAEANRPARTSDPDQFGVFLVWQQPHPIYYAELAFREHGEEVLEQYREVVFETAAFMADFPVWDEENDRFVLGPPLIPAQERYHINKEEVHNPPFELVYWHWGLQTAQRWRERLGMERDEHWDDVLENLSEPPVEDDIYPGVESGEMHFVDHPSMLGALGVMPETPLIDLETMDRTLDTVLEEWQWSHPWGWDFPMGALTAARLGRPEDAIDILLMDEKTNTYLPNGHNYQQENLPTYLPGNGGVLTTVAMMAGGWEDGPDEHAPGFPDDGWTVRHEDLVPML